MGFIQEQMRRKTDPQVKRERRTNKSLRSSWHLPKWVDLKLQFKTRYLLTITGAVLFNWVYHLPPSYVSLVQMNMFFCGFFLWISAAYLMIYYDQYKTWKIRLTMWVDILGIAFVVMNDPTSIPSTALVWVIIVMGNGMRFGMRMFREALAACFLVASITLFIKSYGASYDSISGISVQAMFAAMVIVYSYVLTSRIDQSHREIQQTSRLDSLTSLLNRLSFVDVAEDMLEQASKYGHTLTVMFIDIDKFKAINDSQGHIQGDRVLCKLSSILKASIRADDVAARFGGDEFVLIIRDSNIKCAAEVADRIQLQIREWVENSDFDLSLSIGIGESPTHGSSLEDLLHKVDQAMYDTKFSTTNGGVTCAAV
jgi:diguanylate cyclase (GGDEF)-like protein